MAVPKPWTAGCGSLVKTVCEEMLRGDSVIVTIASPDRPSAAYGSDET